MSEEMQRILIGAVVAIILAWLKRDTDIKLKILSQKVEDSKGVIVKTHDLLNSESLLQAGRYSTSAKRLAVYSKDPVDVEEAEQARRAYEEKKKVQEDAASQK